MGIVESGYMMQVNGKWIMNNGYLYLSFKC